VPSFASYDGTEIGYRLLGDGPPLVCLPGGPGRAAEYLGDLGGLAASRQLVLLDPRGVGSSADPPVLLYAGEVDPMVTPAAVREAAPLFNDATVVVQPGAAHFPWIDDPAAFVAAINAFLG
jgi:pimeloyl-ACP methyl ester carboxylesterase